MTENGAEHQHATHLDILAVIAPDGRKAVLFQSDDFRLIFPPYDAIEVGEAMIAVARELLAERN